MRGMEFDPASYRKSMNNVTLHEKSNWITIVKIAGVFVSWCIGSGFVTGQETLQYFVGYGVWGYAAILAAMTLHIFLNTSFFTLGFEKKYTNPLQIFEYYAGKKLARVFQVFAVALLASAPIVMISGFGAAMQQYFGIPARIGNIMLGVLCLVTILLGLKKLVDICGAIGPLIAVIAIGTGLYYLLTHIGGLVQGMEIAPTLPLNRIAPTWIMAAYYYVCPLHSAPYLAATASTCKTKKEAIYGGILGVILYALCVIIMVSATFTNVRELSTQMIPNLFIANGISRYLGFVFVLLIFLGIYSSCAPCLFTICTSFLKEKTPQYNLFAIALCTVATLISLTMPFDRLFGLIYGVFGFLGGVLILFMIGRHVRNLFVPETAQTSAGD